MDKEIKHKLDIIEKMLFMLLNEEQKEIIRQMNIEYYKKQYENYNYNVERI